MKLFVLIATIYHAGAPADTYVLDSGITGDDCIYAMTSLADIMREDVHLSCEFDHSQ